MKQPDASRRDFLRTGSLFLPGIFLAPSVILSRTRTPSTDLPISLFFGESDLERLRALFAGNPMFASLRDQWSTFDRAAERKFIAEEVRYNDQLFDIARLHRTAPMMAMLYLMTGDRDAANLAADAVRSIMKFPRWDYFLEAGEKVVGIQRASGAALAVALCADWLGETITESERKQWMRTMGERGCEACFLSIYGMRYKDRVVGWTMDESSTYFEHRPGDRVDLSNWPTILDRTNLKAVPAGALAVAALAHEAVLGESADASRWIEQAEYSVGSFRDLYARDGSYDEGISYANYTTLHLAQAVDILKRFGKSDLTDMINWPGYVDYTVGMSMPTHDDPFNLVNFGDNGNPKTGQAGAVVRSGVPLWIARTFRDTRAQWFGLNMAGDFDEWGLIFYDPSIAETPASPGPSVWHSDLDWIVARTGYAAEDLVVAMRSGGPSNHEHADRNSILIKCHGEILVADPYRPPYSFSDPSWMLRTTAAHSAVLINGKGHQYHDGSEGTNPSDAYAMIVRSGERERVMYWTSDATPAYRLVQSDVESITRTVLVLPDMVATLVLDKIVSKTPCTVEARYFADNTDGKAVVDVQDNGFTVSRPTARIMSVASGSSATTIEVAKLPIPEENADKHPFARVAIPAADKTQFILTALVPVKEVAVSATVEKNGSSYTVNIMKGQAKMTIRVTDSGTIPEFDVEV